MATTFKIKRSDTKPFLAVQLQTTLDVGVDLTGGSVFFNLATSDGNFTPIFSGACVIATGSAGNTEYRWTTANTNRSGTFFGEFEFLSGNDIQTFPSDHSLTIKIFEDYDS